MLAATIAGCVASLGLVACAPPPSGPPVAVLFPGGPDDDWGASAEVLRRELADDGYAVEVRFAGDDIPAQLEQLREVLEARPVAVVVAPVDTTSIAAVLGDEAGEGVSIIAYDELIRDSDRVDYFATFDHREAGRLQGWALVEALGLLDDPEAGPFAIEVLAGSGDDPGAQAAFAGAMEVLQPYLDARRITVPSGRTTLEQAAILRASSDTAAARVEELLGAGVELQGVLSPSDAMSAAVAQVLSDAGLQVVPPGSRWTAVPVNPAQPGTSAPTPPPPDATAPPNEDAGPDAGGDATGEASRKNRSSAASVVLTGGGSTLDGARAVLAGTQSATVFEDPRELARAVASMVREVVRGAAPTVTRGATTDNGVREVPTLLLRPELVATLDEAARLLD